MQEEISFGTWLRKQRRALDLSQKALADQVGCAEVTLRRIEAGRLKPSKELAGLLLEKVGIPTTERPQWVSFARGLSGFPLTSIPSSKEPLTNLPAQLTTFIGREKEQADLMRLLAKHRLVTLTGAGGVGKTRLSIKLGEQVLRDYADGVWLVELAPILDPLRVSRAVAIAIGLRDEPQRPVIDMLCDYLREKKMLIILDNCEHLLDACAHLVDTLLKRCPGLKVLATSREVLGILGEAILHVPSLELPDIQQLLEKFRQYESVRLFEERAQLIRTEFTLTIENISSVTKICKRLDGIPLAIELAASRVGRFSTEQIAVQLQESFDFLALGNRTALPRHQTLRAAIDWSYDLLSPVEQALFRRFAVFVGGWTLEAAESVCVGETARSEDIQNLVEQLINKSLIIAEEVGHGSRYRMLETIQRYANEKLIESDESDLVRDKHLQYFLNLAETAEPHLIRPEQLEWLPLLDADHENLRFAFTWALSKEPPESSLILCRALCWFWIIRDYWAEGLVSTKKAIEKRFQNKHMNEKIARARGLYTCALLEWRLGNSENVFPLAEESLALASETSHQRDIAIARYFVGAGLMLRNDDEQARSLLTKSYIEFQELNELFWQAESFPILGFLLSKAGKLYNHDRYLKCVELARQSGERLQLAGALEVYADWMLRMNQVAQAMQYANEADSLYLQIGTQNSSSTALLFAEIAWNNGDFQKANSLFMELREHLSILGDKYLVEQCTLPLGILAMERGDVNEAQEHLEKALALTRELGLKSLIANRLAHLADLHYMLGKPEECKQYFGESVSLRKHMSSYGKAWILMIILGALYFQNPTTAAKLLGLTILFEQQHHMPLKPLEKRYWDRAETHSRKALGDVAFEAALAEGQKLSLDQALDLALQTVEDL